MDVSVVTFSFFPPVRKRLSPVADIDLTVIYEHSHKLYSYVAGMFEYEHRVRIEAFHNPNILYLYLNQLLNNKRI